MLYFFSIWFDSETYHSYTISFGYWSVEVVLKGIRDFCSMDTTQYHDTVCNSNPLEWWIGLSGSYLSEAEIASMEVLIHGWNWKMRSWELFPMLPSGLSLGLRPELFCYMAPLDNSLRQCLLLVGQRNTCSSWKSVLEGNNQAKCGCTGECPQPAVSALVVLSLPWMY